MAASAILLTGCKKEEDVSNLYTQPYIEWGKSEADVRNIYGTPVKTYSDDEANSLYYQDKEKSTITVYFFNKTEDTLYGAAVLVNTTEKNIRKFLESKGYHYSSYINGEDLFYYTNTTSSLSDMTVVIGVYYQQDEPKGYIVQYWDPNVVLKPAGSSAPLKFNTAPVRLK